MSRAQTPKHPGHHLQQGHPFQQIWLGQLILSKVRSWSQWTLCYWTWANCWNSVKECKLLKTNHNKVLSRAQTPKHPGHNLQQGHIFQQIWLGQLILSKVRSWSQWTLCHWTWANCWNSVKECKLLKTNHNKVLSHAQTPKHPGHHLQQGHLFQQIWLGQLILSKVRSWSQWTLCHWTWANCWNSVKECKLLKTNHNKVLSRAQTPKHPGHHLQQGHLFQQIWLGQLILSKVRSWSQWTLCHWTWANCWNSVKECKLLKTNHNKVLSRAYHIQLPLIWLGQLILSKVRSWSQWTLCHWTWANCWNSVKECKLLKTNHN